MRVTIAIMIAALSLSAHAQGGKTEGKDAQVKPKKAAVAQKAPAAKEAAVAPTDTAPTLKQAKPECVYKPVMTDAEINNCR